MNVYIYGWMETGALPLNRLMIETDAPYMTPDKEWLPKAVGIKGRNEPAALPGVCRAVAAALQQDIEDVARASTSNAVRFFGLDEADERIASLVAAPAVEDKLP
jgi:TatD DNase family protein